MGKKDDDDEDDKVEMTLHLRENQKDKKVKRILFAVWSLETEQSDLGLVFGKVKMEKKLGVWHMWPGYWSKEQLDSKKVLYFSGKVCVYMCVVTTVC